MNRWWRLSSAEFSETCQCCVCCLKVMHWQLGILDGSSALETRTTTRGQARVQWRTKVPGGTRAVMSPTLTVATWEAVTHHLPTVWTGVSGKATTTRWDSLKWKSDHLMCELNDNIVCISLANYYSSCCANSNCDIGIAIACIIAFLNEINGDGDGG